MQPNVKKDIKKERESSYLFLFYFCFSASRHQNSPTLFNQFLLEGKIAQPFSCSVGAIKPLGCKDYKFRSALTQVIHCIQATMLKSLFSESQISIKEETPVGSALEC